jgi:hypothetical protein
MRSTIATVMSKPRLRAVSRALLVVVLLSGATVVVSEATPAKAQEPACPTELGGLLLEYEVRDDADGVERLNCSYVPAEVGTASRVVMIGNWVTVGSDPSPSGLCDLVDSEQVEGVRWYGFDYSDSTAGRVWYNADDETLGVDKETVRVTAAALVRQIEPLAQPCSNPAPAPPDSTTVPPPAETVPPETTVAVADTPPTTAVVAQRPGSVCSPAMGELVLTSEVPVTEAGVTVVTCEYAPAPGGTQFPVRVTARWATPDAAPDRLPACGLGDIVESDRAYFSSRVATASIEYVLTRDVGATGSYEPAMQATVRGMLVAIEPFAAPCTGPPSEIGQVVIGVPPGPITLEELAFYELVLACQPTISDFELEQPGRARIVGSDWLGLDCDYTRTGVDAGSATEQDSALVHVAWTKLNGRNARYCLDEPTHSETETRVFANLYDGVRSLETSTAHPKDGDAVVAAFVEAGADLHTRATPLAYVCPNFNEVAFDPIPPYWQEVFGEIPVPPPIILPDEVTSADVISGVAYAGAVVDRAEVTTPPQPVSEPAPEPESVGTIETDETPAATGDEGGPPPDTSLTLTEAAARSPLWRVIGIAGLVLSILGLAVAILLIRKQTRVRPRWDIARLAISAITIVAMTIVIGVDTPLYLIGAGVAAGGIIGLLQGRNLDLRVTERGVFAKRNIIAAVAFAAGLLVVQAAGFANRSGIVALGLTVSYLSAAMAAGLMIGRRPRLVDARGASMAASSVVLGVMLAAGLATPSPEVDAQDQGPDADAVKELLLDMVDWDDITVVGGLWAADGKPMVTISVPRGLAAAPEPIANTVAWVAGTTDYPVAYEITESYRFELDVEGVCCDVTVVADGIRTPENGVPVAHHAEAVVEIRPEGSGAFGVTPFADPIVFSGIDPENPPCGRPVAQVGFQGANWSTWTIDGEPTGGGSVELLLVADCDLPDFTVSNALALAPPAPVAPDQRMQGDLGPCPVLQEIVGPIAEASGIDSGSTSTVGRLYTQPNAPVCDDLSGLGLGDFRPGGLQLTIQWSIASDDVESEVARINEINDDFIFSTRQYGIYDEDACRLDANGDILPPAEGEECVRRQFFAVGSEVTIWTEYSDDGPNVEVRGRFPWGSYWFYCHHCEPGDDMIRDAIAAWHRAGERSTVAADAGPAAEPAARSEATAPAEQDGAEQDGTEQEQVTPQTDDTAVSDDGSGADDDDIDVRDAAAAAIVALIGSVALAGTSLVESGTHLGELPDALRRSGSEAPGDVPAGGVADERGNILLPDDDGRYDWETPNGVERLDRDELVRRIAAERAANAARQAEHQAILTDHLDDTSATDRLADLTERSIAQNDQLIAEIRQGWDRVDAMQSTLDARARALGDLELAEAEQGLATARSSWDQIALDTLEGAGRDVAGLPGEIVDATRFVVQAAADPENWTIAGETFVETVYDTAGILTGNTFGDGAESIGNAAVFTTELAGALGVSLIRDPLGTIVMLTPAQDFLDSIDGDRSLGRRLGSLGIGLVDIGATLSGLGVLNAGDDLIDAARVAERLGDVVDASTDTARATEAALDGSRAIEAGADGARVVETGLDAGLDGGRITGRIPDEMLDPGLVRVRQDIDRAIDAARAEAAARGVPLEAVLKDVPEVRSLYRGDGLQRLGQLEAVGGLDERTASALLSMHDEITSAAVRVGTETSIDDMMRLHGVRPQEVLVGNSGSVGVTRSVMTDADRTVVTVFSDADLDLWRARSGGTRAEAAQDLQDTFRDLHKRNAELALNDPLDPAVRLARESNMTLGEAVAQLDRIGGDDATAAARRLTGGELDMATYSGFGSVTGPVDSYPAGFTRARMSVQGNADVYRVSSTGSVSSYRTSGDAIIDAHELERMRHTGAVTTVDVGGGVRLADPTRIPAADLDGLLRQQVLAAEHYNDVKSVAKAVDRVQYIAGRSGRSMASPRLVDASMRIRANPRGTAAILSELGMSEQQFVDATKRMILDYGTGG